MFKQVFISVHFELNYEIVGGQKILFYIWIQCLKLEMQDVKRHVFLRVFHCTPRFDMPQPVKAAFQ